MGMRSCPHLFHEVSLGGAIAVEHVVCMDQVTSQVHLDREEEEKGTRRVRGKELGRALRYMQDDLKIPKTDM